jgi:hypothetical protein
MSHDVKNTVISRVVVVVIFISGSLLALGVDAYKFVHPMAVLLVIVCSLAFIVTGKLPEHFLLLLFGLLVGPILLCLALRSVWDQMQRAFGAGFARALGMFILLGLVLLSFWYVRLRNQSNDHRPPGHTNERQPAFPIHREDGEGSDRAGH